MEIPVDSTQEVCLMKSLHLLRISPRTVVVVSIVLVLGIVSTYIGIRYAPAFFAAQFAPEKTAQVSNTELAQKAKQTFWDAFYGARYDQLPEVLKLLTAAYLENPRDPQITLYLAHSHLWAISERSRRMERDPRITDHLILADKYFTEAYRLNPGDVRILGLGASVKLALGRIHQDEKLTREGYFMLLRAIEGYPEFNYFTASFVLSNLPSDSERFKEAVEYAWRNLDVCTDRRLDRKNLDYTPFMGLETITGAKRVCWSTPLVPHNFEGFFLHMGDVLTKQGDLEMARRAYETAMLSESYQSWRFKSVLEARLANIEENARRFQQNDPNDQPEIMFNSSYACAACHAK